jgi:hypothetical protein
MQSAVVKVAKNYVKELGKKAVFKNLIHEGSDFTINYFKSVVFPAPLAVFLTCPLTSGLFSSTYKSSR